MSVLLQKLLPEVLGKQRKGELFNLTVQGEKPDRSANNLEAFKGMPPLEEKQRGTSANSTARFSNRASSANSRFWFLEPMSPTHDWRR